MEHLVAGVTAEFGVIAGVSLITKGHDVIITVVICRWSAETRFHATILEEIAAVWAGGGDFDDP